VRVLTVNAGSSSIKLRVVDGEQLVESRDLVASDLDQDALAELGPADATAHRFAHGGPHFHAPVRIDGEVESGLRALSDLAPLHQAAALQALDVTRAVLPDLPAVACFDTTFHATLPPAAATYAVPRDWGVRRYGFHGLSHAYASRRAAELLERPPAELRTVVCHLGAGASLCAVRAGRSVDTTMGFTPLEGLVMATRSGSVDPGALLWLLEHRGMTAGELDDALEHESGLLALAGSAEMRDVLTRADDGDADATLARDVYLHRLAAGIAAMAAALGGMDALVFTAGVGENAPAIRASAAERLAFLGVRVDTAKNVRADGDADLSQADAAVRTLVIRAREDLEMARQAERVLG
jgi:acetate kinase